MGTLERRITELESSVPHGDLQDALIGAPPIQFDWRGLAFEYDGFDIEEIAPREVRMVFDWEAIRAHAFKESALLEKLRCLDRVEREKLAQREGYRVIYPPEGFTPRAHARTWLQTQQAGPDALNSGS